MGPTAPPARGEPLRPDDHGSVTRPGSPARPAYLERLAQPRVLWAGFLAAAALRLIAISTVQLAPNEAYYWVWSRRPALSYFDHPPMAAWLIRFSTALLGTSELSVRLPAAVMSLASILIVMLAARALSGDRRLPVLTGILLLASPLTVVLGTLTTPDSPAWFFGCGAIACAGWAARADPRRAGRLWAFFGFLLGLAMLSKYTTAAVGGAVFLGLVTGTDGRRHLERPWFWLAAAISLAVFSPVLYWNATHGWASFLFQMRHGLGDTEVSAARNIGEYLVGQLFVWTPPLFVISAIAVGQRLRRAGELAVVERVLLACALVPLGAFLFSATRHRVEVNWPALAYAPLAVLTCHYALSIRPRGPVAWCLRHAIHLAAIGALCAQFPTTSLNVARRVVGRAGGKGAQLYGYRELAARVDALRGDMPVFANRYQDAAELCFYLRGRPDVWALNTAGSRPNAYDYFDGRPAVWRQGGAVFVNFPQLVVSLMYPASRMIPAPVIVGPFTLRIDRITVAAFDERDLPPGYPSP